jgi:small subunit ribosomal protein S6
MTETRINTYEGLFLFPQSATANLREAADYLKEILHRAHAEVISFRKWEERRLAYEIGGNKRGVYFLVYFKADRTKLVGIERDVNLSEKVLRAIITRADHVPAEVIAAAEGRQQLEDEIKLRGEQAASGAMAAESTSRVRTGAAVAEDEESDVETVVDIFDEDEEEIGSRV